ncbi:heme ABC exporter ATP-binding protein CcmA [Geochorda subterranea]|uniref:Heme ABC exporter ATP-binding protein CcmA n=1 Tax=Geochorda subterranea TaxID=3109564 RepID=A0ABZ1BMQ4_9FIRM|nr:heme ABC exporter ATP-binding protein CcmA [Limnochorda sp. LNt]WRP14110.1 heme ABC exporter ATP-binding protein CcmA [Limnochorda sp. LNt]
MIQAEGVVKSFGGRPVLAGLDLTVESGEAVALFGPNGAGKSTLVRALAGLIRIDRGRILIAGVPVDRTSPELRRRIGLLAHQGFLYDNLSAEENLHFWARLYGVPDRGARIQSLLRRVGLWAFASDPVRTYSRGMIQRLALARVLLHEPELYLLDEPFTGLDRAGVRLLREILAELVAARRTVVVVSHRPDEVVGICQRFCVLTSGRIRHELRPPEVDRAVDGAALVRSLEELVEQASAPDVGGRVRP